MLTADRKTLEHTKKKAPLSEEGTQKLKTICRNFALRRCDMIRPDMRANSYTHNKLRVKSNMKRRKTIIRQRSDVRKQPEARRGQIGVIYSHHNLIRHDSNSGLFSQRRSIM